MPRQNKKSRSLQPRNGPRNESRPTPPADLDAPHWLLDEGRWIKMPDNMRQLVSRILTPAYRRFVLEAPDELERSVGMTLVHLMWLELSAQIEIGKVVADPQSPQAVLNDPEKMIDRHLRLTASKCQTAELLLKLQTVQAMLKHPSFTPSPDLPALEAQDRRVPFPPAARPFLPSPFCQTTEDAENGKSTTC